ncbi:unnamed protein product [Ixodes pacificus]
MHLGSKRVRTLHVLPSPVSFASAHPRALQRRVARNKQWISVRVATERRRGSGIGLGLITGKLERFGSILRILGRLERPQTIRQEAFTVLWSLACRVKLLL